MAIKLAYTYSMPLGRMYSDPASVSHNFERFLAINGKGDDQVWYGHMRARDQRVMTGRCFAGRKYIYLYGQARRIKVGRFLPHGLGWAVNFDMTWQEFVDSNITV